MKKRKCLRIVVTMLMMVMLVTGCGKNPKSDMSGSTESSNGNYDGYSESAEQDTSLSGSDAMPESAADTELPKGEADGLNNSAAVTSESLEASPQDKIIKNYYLEAETQKFDDLIAKINDEIKSLGGYVESSSISGQSYFDDNVSRSGNIVARIPNEKADEFVNTVDKEANVTRNQSSSENVTLKYIDAESRVETLKIEQERLFAILEKSEKLESIITLESRLSEIRYELQNYESQLRSYDNLVDYSTITLTIQEVERITPVTEVKPSFATRVGNGFSDTLYSISEGFKNFMVWFIVNSPYLLIWGIIIFIIVIVSRKYIKKYLKSSVPTPPTNYGQFNQTPPQQQTKEDPNQQKK